MCLMTEYTAVKGRSWQLEIGECLNKLRIQKQQRLEVIKGEEEKTRPAETLKCSKSKMVIPRKLKIH